MPLEKQSIIDQIEVAKSGVVQIRTVTHIVEDGALVSSSLHRYSVAPGDDYSDQDVKVQAICKVAHTSDVITAYKVAQTFQIPA
jgi:hypothetical protein